MRAPHAVTSLGALLGAPLLAALFSGACSNVNVVPTPMTTDIGPDARNYCAIAGACQLTPTFGFGECINAIAREQITLAPFGGDQGAQARYDCVKAAGTDCTKAKTCFGRVQANDARCTNASLGDPYPGQQASFCDGSRITVCSGAGNDSQSFLCGDDFDQQHFGGPLCVKNAAASALCGFTTCEADGGMAAFCQGNTLVYCTNGVLQRTDCSALGGKCDASAGQCSQTCSGGAYACMGTQLVKECTGGGTLPLYDCAARTGWTCRVPPDSITFGCVPPEHECEWGVYQAKCADASRISFCNDGKIDTYDCKDSGASKCVTSDVGVTCAL